MNVKRMGYEVRAYIDPLRVKAGSPVPASAAAAVPFDVGRVVDGFLATFRAGRS
jgi:hypothetical protein